MAATNKILKNSKTGQLTRFIQTSKDTDGKLLEMESTYPPFSAEPPPHYHPYQDEYFIVLEGELTVRMSGAVRVLKTGEKLHVPPNAVHSMWNNTGVPLTVNWKVQPAMQTEYFFETLTGLANDNRSDAAGRPTMPQLALTAIRFNKVFRLAKPPFAVQRIVFGILGIIGTFKGYKGDYQEYLD